LSTIVLAARRRKTPGLEGLEPASAAKSSKDKGVNWIVDNPDLLR
jgi:hypothetical protein